MLRFRILGTLTVEEDGELLASTIESRLSVRCTRSDG